MRSYLSLIPISARVHKRQSRMTRICIVLAVFLVTSIFSMSEMWTKSETTAMRRNHGDWHIALQNVPEETVKQIREHSDIARSAWCDSLESDTAGEYQIGGEAVLLYGAEERYLTQIMQYPAEGSCPRSAGEIALSACAKSFLGVQLGDKVSLHTPAGELSYTVSGFYEDGAGQGDFCAYMERAAFAAVCAQNGKTAQSAYYIRFRSERGLQKTIAALKQEYGLNGGAVRENTGVLGMLGASSSTLLSGFYQTAAVCFVIILISGVFMISGCMNSNVAQRTQFFGMMRCIGASREQIIRFVRLEALHWCKTAIPIGCGLGTVTCWILCVILRFLVKGEWVDMPLFSVSPIGLVSGAVVGVVTVFLAAQSPARRAAKVSPVAAVSGNAALPKRRGCAAKTGLFRVETALGLRHAGETKKNLLLMTGSFALMIVLFFAAAAGFDFVQKLLLAESDFTPDLSIVSQDDANSLDKDLLREISALPGVGDAFGVMFQTACPVTVNGRETKIDLFSYSDGMLRQFEDSTVSGTASSVYGDSGYAMAVYNQANSLKTGDKIQLGGQELEIACVTSEGIGGISGAATVACSEQTFTRLTGVRQYAFLGVMLEKDAPESSVTQILRLAGENPVTDNRAQSQDTYSSYWVFRLAVAGFLAIIALITVLNIMNSISMGVSARLQQYGAMRAVGMESRQVTKMIAAEALTYAASGTLVGTALGVLLHRVLYAKLILSHFGGAWGFPLAPFGIVVLLVSVSCAAAVYAPAKRIRNMPITATLNEL